MMKSKYDPLGYYQTLDIKPGSDIDEIKKAYRQKAMKLHPDRNPGKDTTAEFQALQSAYQVLSDPSLKAEYDTLWMEAADSNHDHTNEMEPAYCSSCGCVSAQPRYVIFRKVVSYILVTTRSGTQGVFCSDCAFKVAMKNSGLTWLFGWWGFPWGPIYSVPALIKNMLGGEKPAEQNAYLLAYQATYFFNKGNDKLAYAIANEALNYAIKFKKQSGNQTEANDLINRINHIIQQTKKNDKNTLVDQWSFFNKSFKWQASVMAIVIGFFIILFNLPDSNKTSKTPRRHYSQSSTTLPIPITGVLAQDRYLDAGTTPSLVISSDLNGPNYVIKLSNTTYNNVITAFLRPGEQIDILVPPGYYELKLASGYSWYGWNELFGSDTNYSKIDYPLSFQIRGDQLMGHQLTLKQVRDGNLRRTRIDKSQF